MHALPAQGKAIHHCPLFAVVGSAPTETWAVPGGQGQPPGFRGGWRTECQAGQLCQRPSRGPCTEETAFPFWALSHQLWVCEKRQAEGWCLKQVGCGQRDSFCEDRTMPPSPGGMLGSHSLCISASKAGWVCTHSRCFPTLMDGGLRTCSISGERKSRKM